MYTIRSHTSKFNLQFNRLARNCQRKDGIDTMMREEFYNWAGIDRLDDKEWEIVNTVYTWSSQIPDNSESKKEIVRLYKFGGINLLGSLLPEAKIQEQLDGYRNVFKRQQKKWEDVQTILKNLSDYMDNNGDTDELWKQFRYWEGIGTQINEDANEVKEKIRQLEDMLYID